MIGMANINWLTISGGVINAEKIKENKMAYLLLSIKSFEEIRLSFDKKNAKA